MHVDGAKASYEGVCCHLSCRVLTRTLCGNYRLGGRQYLGVLDTGASISIVAKKALPPWYLKNIMPTAAIHMGDGHVVHSCGDCEVDVPIGSRSIAHWFYVMDTEPFDFVLRTDPLAQYPQMLSLTLQVPYVDHDDGQESVLLSSCKVYMRP